MTTAIAPLDKSVETSVGEGFGTITIRVLVLGKGVPEPQSASEEDETPLDLMPDEMLPETDKRVISGYLEEPKRGRYVCVFLINGQRQHVWDNQFIMRDLELKYLRNHMLVIIDCDGLRPEAIAELMQGSRHQFYEGNVYSALESRVLATLKGDPDLRRLEEEAEDDIASLQAGDEMVKAALDQLIEAHHESASRVGHGHEQPGDATRRDGSGGRLIQTQDVVIESDLPVGSSATDPVLQIRPDVATIRLKPNDERQFLLYPRPEAAWRTLQSISVTFDPPVKELQVTRSTQITGEDVALKFAEPDDFDEDEYPIETTLRATASFSGYQEVRLIERRVVVTPGTKGPTPRPPKPLVDDPSFIKVTSRQPIKIVVGGPDVHVKLRWDGKDSLLGGASPEWSFRVSCESDSAVPATFLTRPVEGRFELLIQATPSLKNGDQLNFNVEAISPSKTLATAFLADVVDPPSARKLATKVAGGAQRRPPYELKYLERKDWSDGNLSCFGQPWSGAEPGSFEAPSAKSPLTIFINQDTDLLTTYRDALLSRKLVETTIKQRINKYTAHVAFHLYQMFEKQKKSTAQSKDEVETPSEVLMREEIQRVAHTLIKLMEVTQ